jgi:ABC-type bacteriocin/lantibiotic exporter with double-glycine peptidase domain
LSGLIQPNQGAISINDNSFKKINLNQFRSQIEVSYMEKLHLKGLCLKILLKKRVSEETLKWAIEGMQLKEFIKSLPQGLDTAL